jgi:signal transduction histidine kinase/streptogramin lyase
MPLHKPLTVLSALLLVITCMAQQRIRDFTVYGRDNGLPQNSYHEVFETSDGYLWASSASGLFRFDGKRFLQINSLYSNPNSPADNNIIGFEEDNNGNLWMAGFFSGVTKYNLRSGKFRQYKRLSQDSTAAYGTFCVYKDKAGTMWIGTAGRGIAEYLPATDTFRFFYPDPAKATDGSKRGENFVTGIAEDKHNPELFWISTFHGLYLFNKKTHSFKLFPCSIMIDWGPLNTFLKLEQDDDHIYLGTWFSALVIFDKRTRQFSRVPYERKGRFMYHYAIGDAQMVDDSLLYLACMNDGLLCYNTRSGKLTPLLTQEDIPLRNVEINIQQVSLTKHAGLFAGGNSFIYQSHPRYTRFNRLLHYEADKKTDPNISTGLNSVVYDEYRNGYWMAVYNYPGLIFFDSSFSSSIKYPGKLNPQPWFDDVSLDALHDVWMLDAYGALYKFDTINKTPVLASGFSATAKFSAGNKLLAIEGDGKGNTWLVGANEIYHYNPVTTKLTTFSLPLQEIKSRNKNGIWRAALRCDSKGNAWIGTHAGLLHCDLATGKVGYYNEGPGELASMVIKSLTVDKQDNVWIGYFNEGLQLFDTRLNKVTKAFTMEDGLPSMEINYLDCDSDNDILACTHSGLAIFKRSINAWQYINTYDGLKRDYLDVPVFVSHGKTILDQVNSFLVMDDGMDDYPVDSIFTHITSISINGKPFHNGVLPDYTNSLTLPSAVKDIKIEFSAMHWQFPLRTQYYYRVDNIHKQDEWIPVPEAVVNLTGLSSGHYAFHFYAVTADGVRTPERVLSVTIRPPFWKTWWFRILLALLIMGLFYAIYKYRINQLRKLHDMRNTISRDLHDDIGASLGNISILNELAKRHSADVKTTTDYLDRAGEDIQHISESLSDIVWNINPRYDELDNLFVRMKRYAADMFDGRGIAYEISLPAVSDNISLPMTRRRDFYLIFKESVHNLAKYSQATQAVIQVTLEKHRLILKVIDNGIGFDTGTVMKGNGLHNMKQRAKELQGVLKIDSEIGKGTTIVLSIPLH